MPVLLNKLDTGQMSLIHMENCLMVQKPETNIHPRALAGGKIMTVAQFKHHTIHQKKFWQSIHVNQRIHRGKVSNTS